MKPKHIAVSLEKDIGKWSEMTNKSVQDTYSSRSELVHELVRAQIRLNIPILTVFLLSSKTKQEHIVEAVDSLAELFKELAVSQDILQNQVKVGVLGKWYSLPDRLVDIIKCVIDETKEFDKFFLNFCIMYDGQEEVVDACKLIGRRIEAEKLDPEAITREIIKEDLYTSYFLAPDLVVINGDKRLNGFLLWDISNALIYFTGKEWPEFRFEDLKKAIDLFELVN
ncbi:di-trans,poly-cis-decaprenylcistransferase [Candidatus Woesearchaeota archaeon]|nr:di-trans,poly-cis-decaprenylcistransferase [Candidatus Woesearchaeota archaeon]